MSYAHAIPAGPEPRAWGALGTDFTATLPVVANRGPEVRSVKQKPDGTVTPVYANANSNAFRFHGKPAKWAVGYNDNHVNLESVTTGGTYTAADGRPYADCIFYDEPDDKAGSNRFLGILIKAGPSRKDFVAIWD